MKFSFYKDDAIYRHFAIYPIYCVFMQIQMATSSVAIKGKILKMPLLCFLFAQHYRAHHG